MPPNFASIVTVEEFNAYTKETVAPTDDTNLDFKQALILRCAPAIEKYTGLLMQQAAKTDIFDGDGGRGFFLNYRPVNSITSVTVSGTVLAATEYALKSGIGYLKFKNSTTDGWQNYTAVYSAGYGYTDGATANSVPLPIRQACLVWVAYAYKKAVDRRHGVSAKTLADQSTTYFEKGMPEDVAELLNPYRQPMMRVN